MSDLNELLSMHVGNGTVPGAVAVVARGDDLELAVAGSVDIEGTAPMARDTIFRIASLTKQLTAAGVMLLLEDGRIGLDDPIGKWLPELAEPKVVRTPSSPADDVVPAVRPITVEHLLSSRAGWGFPSDFTLPAVGLIFDVQKSGLDPQAVDPPDAWLAALSRVPLVYQPGEGWLYNICSDLQGVLISRVTGQPLPDFLAERLFEPLGMADTGFEVPAGKLGCFTSLYRTAPDGGGLVVADAPDGQWSSRPAFPSGAGGLVSTADDWLRFARMLLAGGIHEGRRVLSTESVRQMTTDHLTQAQRDIGELFLDGQGWGYGASVDLAPTRPWNEPGRYGWTGGSGTAGYVSPASGTISLLLTQVAMDSPVPPPVMRDFWTYVGRGGS
ncbi:serine hydrolase domain-containing protein [Actinopolymorpha singaporensis]|uniref:CubicO group peptidase, beta-lactamase class C family n=1 Tax=Actinopolymorpha singaporensis TaxID=117157 RepID=A0A1H1W152_9ACTN|nr:serine hydrolase domain-containing protein [Actinopolymorpha singaporensis]SDS90998.1 CubicO group peptidase, beta-lactamase class C family [Actinopolymorpha singaporensis]